jgi:YVTN family beta-propeller protein
MEPANFCFNDDGGQLFVSGPGMDAVSIVYPYNTELAETILAGRGPESMSASADPAYLFVANPQSGTVTVLDIDTRKLVAVAQVGGDPGQILFTPDSQYALILNRGSGDLAVMRIRSLRTSADGKTRRYTSPPIFTLIPVGSGPVSAAVVPA